MMTMTFHSRAGRCLLLSLTTVACLATLNAHAAKPAAAGGPKLVVVLVVDGLPQEQVSRYRSQYGQGGLRRMLDEGASFSSAHQAHGITYTAVGHAAILSGAYPNQHGIISNDWIDYETGQEVYCTDDIGHKYLNGEATAEKDGTSPARLRVSTLGDEMRYASGNRAKVVTVSGKDRGAILLAGKTGTAYMYMEQTGNFASSSYYMAKHPAWATDYLAKKPQERYFGKPWDMLLAQGYYSDDAHDDFAAPRAGIDQSFPSAYTSASGKPDAKFYAALKKSPFLDELTLDFARAAVVGENLGNNPAGVADLLGVSLSAHDYVNHAFGPESRLSHDHLQRVDRMLSGFFTFLDKQVGMDNVLVVFTADHGFPNVPDFSEARGVGGQRLLGDDMLAKLNESLAKQFLTEKLVKKSMLPMIYLDYALADARGLKREDIEAHAARFLLKWNGVAEVFTRSQLERGETSGTHAGILMQRAWHRQLSGDLIVVQKPNWIFKWGTNGGTSHGSPYNYDTNVPLMIMGKRWIKPGYYGQYTEIVDIAPTVAHLLRVRKPSAAFGRVLTEVLR